MKLNKKILTALLLGAVLTGCDSVVQNDNAQAPVVEENTDTAANEATETAETETMEETTPDNAAETTDAEGEEATEETDTAETEVAESNMTAEEQIEMLEQAIFDARSSARAVELLFEIAPEQTVGHEDRLNQLVEETNALIAEAQQAIDQLRGQN